MVSYRLFECLNILFLSIFDEATGFNSLPLSDCLSWKKELIFCSISLNVLT